MNNLANLTQKLKLKPRVDKEEVIKVDILPEQEIPGKRNENKDEKEQPKKAPPVATEIIAEKDNGSTAVDLLKRLAERGLTKVDKKIPAVAVAEVKSKAPIIEDELKRTKPKKQKAKAVLEGDIEQVEDVVEGGPSLLEPGLEVALLPAPAKVPKRHTKQIITDVINLGPTAMIQIGDTPIGRRLPPQPVYDIKASAYYMNNREIFVNFINDLFEPYRNDLMDESQNISCDEIGKDTGKLGLLTHQKIVRDYINLYTPYRGLLLFHGLGSGKTCSSIAIAEGLKSYKQIFVMTPASLRRNYMEEIKKCGDLIFRKNQYWEWISVDDNKDLIEPLAEALGGIKINYDNKLHSNWINYITRHRGVWLVNVTKPSNYEQLTSSDKKSLNDQLDEMIQLKYKFINYNGIRRKRFKEMTNDFTSNVFDNSVVIIDEAHNFISRIVNKISKAAKFSERKKGPDAVMPTSLALLFYEFLLQAENCRIIMLTGTPIINYPNEIAVLYNILRGYIKTWHFTLDTKQMEGKKLNLAEFQKTFSSEKILDYIDFHSTELSITRNPFGFENKITVKEGYKGVYNRFESLGDDGKIVLDERGVMSDADFISRVIKILKKSMNITINPKDVRFTVNTALPDTIETFVNTFIDNDTGRLINEVKFKRRIIGLTSYFKSAQEELLPKYNRDIDRHVVRIPMSDYQFQIYERARHDERDSEKPKKGSGKVDVDGLFIKPKATYKIFSRLFCNFVMPTPPGRPTPNSLRLAQSKDWIAQYLKESNDRKVNAVQENIKNYVDSLPSSFKENPENIDLIKRKIEEYIERIIKQQYDVVDFDTFFSEEYQARLIEYDKKKAARLLGEPKPPTKAEILEAKAQQKAAEKEEKDRLKAAEKEEKDRLKAAEKEAKDRLKAEEKQAKERLKAAEKEAKELQKADKKKAKAKGKDKIGDDDTSSSDSDSDSSSSGSESDGTSSDSDDEIPSYLRAGAKTAADKATKGKKAKKDEKEDTAAAVAIMEGVEETKDPLADVVDQFEDFYESADEDEDDDDEAEKNIGYIEGYKDEDANDRKIEELEGDEILEKMAKNLDYKTSINEALDYLKRYKQKYLSLDALRTYSPKFLTMIENIEDPQHPGLHLVYSQFRSMEGIGIFALALETNGYARFKITRTSAGWELVTSDEDIGKPHYALYTGTEDAEEREIIRNIFNGDWKYIPNNIASKLRTISNNNNMGEIIKVLMITSAGSEGINLRNTRYVHIMEPYWHPVRLQQVIGRARRICSHQGLPEELRTVEVFIYLMVFTQQQLDSEFGIEIKLKDRSNIEPFFPQSSDEKLFEISTIKENLTDQILRAIKSSSIDCITHSKSNVKEGIVCLSFGDPPINKFSYNPNIEKDQNDTIADINMRVIDWDVKEIIVKSTGKQYMLRLDTNEIYDYDSIIQAKQIPGIRPVLLGQLAINVNGEYEIFKRKK
jgi:hypothetical protein